jgi:ubiquitin-like protein ATG12
MADTPPQSPGAAGAAPPPAPSPGGAEPAAAAAAAAAAGDKIKIHLMAVGSAPILKKSKFRIGSGERFSTLMAFLRKQLRLAPGDEVFGFCCSAFAPSPDEPLDSLYRCFGVNGELVVSYALVGAYG